MLGIGVLFLSLLLYVTADINLQRACITVVRRLLKTVALRQVRKAHLQQHFQISIRRRPCRYSQVKLCAMNKSTEISSGLTLLQLTRCRSWASWEQCCSCAWAWSRW